MTEFYAPWQDSETAAAYGEFCRTFDLYRRGSQQLTAMIDLANAHSVLDLACGTGSTTAVMLPSLPQDALVIAVDVSAEMLAEARRTIDDPRWLQSAAEEVDTDIDQKVDAVVCSAAIWQTDLERTFPAVRRLLAPGGSLVFDIPVGFVTVPEATAALPSASLASTYRDVASEMYELTPARRRRAPYTFDRIRDLLHAASLNLQTTRVVDLESTPEEMRAWLEIPIMSDQFGGQLTREQRQSALSMAWDRLAKDRPREVVRDVLFGAVAL